MLWYGVVFPLATVLLMAALMFLYRRRRTPDSGKANPRDASAAAPRPRQQMFQSLEDRSSP